MPNNDSLVNTSLDDGDYDIVRLGDHALAHGDCLRVMDDMPDHSVDLILTDLPYGTTALKWDTVIPFDALWEQYHRVAKPNAPIVLFGCQPFTTALIASNIKNFKYSYVWVKNTQTGIALSRTQPMRKHEDICVFYRNTPVYNKKLVRTKSAIMLSHSNKGYGRGVEATHSDHLPNMALNRSGFKEFINPSTVIEFNTLSNRSKDKYHSTQKPTDLLAFLIRTHSNSGDLVLDSCMGAGTTGVACVKEDRQFFGIELERKYFDISVKRITQEMELT